jgi:hypothetical protein
MKKQNDGKEEAKPEPPPTPEETLKALQNIINQLKTRGASSGVTVDLAAAVGDHNKMNAHIRNLADAVEHLQRIPREALREASKPDSIYQISPAVAEGTMPFRVKHKLIEPALQHRTTTFTIEQLEEAVLVLRAYSRIK